MRYMVMHRTNPRWEAGEIPSHDEIARVGALMGELVGTGMLLDGDGLRASAHGVRLDSTKGRRTATKGPFVGGNELPAGFLVLRTASLDDAVSWAWKFADVFGDAEIDVRPMTESWDLGLEPVPEGLSTRRYMALRKAGANDESGTAPTEAQRAALRALLAEMRAAEVLLSAQQLRPSATGARIQQANGRVTVVDGPFTESKELLAGYVIVQAPAIEDAIALGSKYALAVGCHELDVRLVADEE